ncbi:MAG: OmpH family outer membrane protein [Deltaproteobacteria bacterium]|nr:OmpH family outer membrane protein [Deltaproteobacteria bacterium]
MLKIILTLFVLIACSSSPVPLAGAEEKIALVNLQQALNEVEEGKKAKAAIQADMDAKKKELEALKGALTKMKTDLEKQQSVLSKDAIASKSNEIQGKFMELQQKAMQYEQELKTKEEASVKSILNALKVKVGEMAKAKGYTLVFENSADVVLYSSGVDITSDLISQYNKK